MSDLRDWSVSAGGNTSTSPDGFPEGMPPSGVNDAAREVMAAVARNHRDEHAYRTASAVGNNFTHTFERSVGSYAQGMVAAFIAPRSITSTANLAISALAYKPLKDAGGNHLEVSAIVSDQLVVAAYAAKQDEWRMVSPLGHSFRILQIVHQTDNGSSHSNTSYANMNNSTVNIVPRSPNSKLLIEVAFHGTEADAVGNTVATFQIYESPFSGTGIGFEPSLTAALPAGAAAIEAPIILRHQLNNSGTASRGFGLQGKTSSGSAAVSATKMVWTITEYLV